MELSSRHCSRPAVSPRDRTRPSLSPSPSSVEGTVGPGNFQLRFYGSAEEGRLQACMFVFMFLFLCV